MRHEEACPSQETSFPVPSNRKKPCFEDRAKAKAKKALNLESSDDGSAETPYKAAYEELNDSPAFNSSKLLNKARIGPTGFPVKAIAFVQGIAEALVNPKSEVKRAQHEMRQGN